MSSSCTHSPARRFLVVLLLTLGTHGLHPGALAATAAGGGPVLVLDEAPQDTIPAHARIDFRWHAEPSPGSHVVEYHYKLDEQNFVVVDSSVHAVSYNTDMGDEVAPGTKLFTLRAVDNLGQEREVIHRFQVNFAPDTWFAGPDLALLVARFGWSGAERCLDIGDWQSLPDLSGTH